MCKEVEMRHSAIKDAEWRLGSYLAANGHEKTDQYAKKQIELINQWTKEINELEDN